MISLVGYDLPAQLSAVWLPWSIASDDQVFHLGQPPAIDEACHICDNGLIMRSPRFHSHALSSALADELLTARRRGSAVRSAEKMRTWFGLSQGEFADLVGVSRQTVNRWKMTGTGPAPDTAEAGLLSMMAQIKAVAEQTWDSSDDFRRWMRTPLPILRMKRAIDFLKPSGLTVVLDLVRAEAGGGYS